MRTPPDLAGFLRSPAATPTSCPPSVGGSTSGLRSPWVGHVDVSVFVVHDATPATLRALKTRIEALPHVRRVYFESTAQAYQEFRRLYTCSAQVSPGEVPASYRLVLGPVSGAARDGLVRVLEGLRGVDSVSCDPSDPCTNVLPSPARSSA